MTTYADLKAFVAAFAHREDLNEAPGGTTTTAMDFFFGLAHNEILARIDWQSLEKSDTLLGSGFTQYDQNVYAQDLPDGTLRVRSVTVNGEDIQYFPPGQLVHRFGRGGTSQPLAWSVVGRQLLLAPGAADAHIVYQFAEPAMVNDEDENVIAAVYPNLYIWGALAQLHAYVQDSEEQAKSERLFDIEMEQVNNLASRTRYGVAPAMVGV